MKLALDPYMLRATPLTAGERRKLGAYNAVLHDRSLPEALKVLADLGLTSAEINSGDARARDAGVKVCDEMHPQNTVFNPSTLRRLVERTGATHVGVGMDPSHLFWPGIDPVAVDPEMAVNIEHEDQAFDPVEGLRLAAETRIAAKAKAGV